MQEANHDLFYLWIKAIVINPDGKYLLLKTSKYYDLPGGRVMIGENHEESFSRELFEETWISKYKVINDAWMFVMPYRVHRNNADFWLVLRILIVSLEEHQDILLSHEHESFQWCWLSILKEHLWDKFPWHVFDGLE